MMPGDEDDIGPDEPETLPALEPTVDAGAPAAVKQQKRGQARIQRENAEFYRQALSSQIGRRCLWDILNALHPFETMYGVGPNGFPNNQATIGYMAEQQAGLRLYTSWLQLDRAGVLLMQDEHDPRFAKKSPPKSKREPDA